MLTKLLPDQISSFWDVIRYAIENSLPPIAGESPDKMKKILMSLLSGKMQCWASYEISEKRRILEGIVVTRISYDDASDTRNLLIYCLYSYERVGYSNWTSGLKTLVKFAESRNCERIIAYTSEPGVIELVKKLKGDVSYTFVSIPLR